MPVVWSPWAVVGVAGVNISSSPLSELHKLAAELHVAVAALTGGHIDFLLRGLDKRKSVAKIPSVQLRWLSWFPWTSIAYVITTALWEMYSCRSFSIERSRTRMMVVVLQAGNSEYEIIAFEL